MAWRTEGIARDSMVRTSEARALLSTRDFQRGCVSQTISAAGKASRSAATAGKVWTMSPSEPRRRTRKRGSDMRSLADVVEEIAGGVIFGVAHDGDADAEAGCGGALGYSFGGVVGAFGVDVGTEEFEERFDVGFAKEEHKVDRAESGD